METKNKKIKKNTESESKDKKEKSHPLIISPRITEKSAKNAEVGIYTFNVISSANKNEIKKAIKFLYGVIPKDVSITNIADKTISRRGILSVKRGGKKAVVYLKKDDKITFA